MDDAVQAQAYARADFSEPNGAFVNEFLGRFVPDGANNLLDLGCGPADISMALARALPSARVVALDGATAMLDRARDTLARDPLTAARVALVHSLIPVPPKLFAGRGFDAIVSNSLLHHLHDPALLWQTLEGLGAPEAAILIMDLRRPASRKEAANIVERYAADEAPILQVDFFNSLLAAFTPDEVRAQLAAALLPLTVEVTSDRHMLVWGRLPGQSSAPAQR
jgi:trans-aconitate methyltransferase